MRIFNPEKELNKIQKGNKNKIIIGVISLLLIVAIGSSYAIYQIKYNKRIIYTTVDKFYSKDIQISLYVDGEKDTTSETFPDKESGKIFSHITCENGSSGVFDNTKWELSLKITKQDKCNVYFITGNLPNPPELYQGMIPVVYDNDGNVYVADVDSDWYNYQDHRWGNAVLVDNTKEGVTAKYFDSNNKLREDISGEQIPMDEILQMYVWIPRYKYELFNAEYKSSTPKQIINIKFEKGIENTGNIKCTYTNNGDGTITESCLNKEGEEASNGEWYTHPAFTFKGTTEDNGTELKGIWIGKFEPSDPMDENGRFVGKINEITILPGKTSMINKSVSSAFIAEQALSKEGNKYNLKHGEVDTRVMKNMEWGAVAYLTQSLYGIYKDENTCNIDGMDFNECEVWINNTAQGAASHGVTNNDGGTYTGCAGDTVSAAVQWNIADDGSEAKCDEDKRWNTGGVNASTTGNIYGIYDMSGGAQEYLMGVILQDGKPDVSLGNSGFNASSLPDPKYYDIYAYDDEMITQERGYLGDATKEIMQTFNNLTGAWNSDYAAFPHIDSSANPWILRGGMYGNTSSAGVFRVSSGYGGWYQNSSFRSVLTAA